MADARQDRPSLADAPWLARAQTQAVFTAIGAKGHGVRAVGGAVRNGLLGLDVSEVDLATTAKPEEVVELATAAGLKPVPTGIEHGTVTVVSGGEPFEVTTLRRDVETYGRKAKVAFTDDWKADAGRRDFTMNALYADADGTVHDPLGGLADLKAGRVRFIGEAHERIREDYLRILRFFRFNARFGKLPLDGEGLSACVRERGGLAGLSGERVRMELLKLLAAKGAGEVLEAMFDHGLLVDVLGGVPVLPRLLRLAAIEAGLGLDPDPLRRLAALAVLVPEDAERLGRRLKLSNREQAALDAAAGGRAFDPRPAEAQARILLYRLGDERFSRAALQAWAQSGAAQDDVGWRGLADLPARWSAPQFPLRGADLVELGVDKGPRVGQLMKQLEDAWIAEGMGGTREDLLQRARGVIERGNRA